MSKFEVKLIKNILHGPKVDVNIDNRGVGKLLFDKFREHGEKICQINGIDDEKQTYNFVNEKCVRVALEMKKRGILSNDVVLICSSNNMDSIVPLVATLYLNAIAVTLDPSVSLRDTSHLLKIVRPKMIFVQEASIELIEFALEEGLFKTEIIVMGNHNKYSTYAQFLEPKNEEESFIPNDVESIRNTAVIFFSSGTTGMPKAIELSHYTLIYDQSIKSTGVQFKDVIHFTSLYWISAVLLTFNVIRNGGRKIVIKGFQPELALKCLHEYKIVDVFLAPSMSYTITEDLVQRYPCPELKNIMFGGSTISNEQMRKVRNYFPHSKVFLGYAQTEAGGLISCFSLFNINEKLESKVTSSGQPVANTIIKIVDIDSEEILGPNKKGEIRVLIPTVCNGYYNQDSSNMLDKDGYVKTGDVGYYDEDNCLYVCDRIKEMFKYQGWHIVPLSLENVICEHPAVHEALVIGMPSEADGHIPMALVVLRKDSVNVNEDDLLKFANEKLLEREQLRAGLKIVKCLPKGTTGKILRKYVTELVVGGQLEKLME